MRLIDCMSAEVEVIHPDESAERGWELMQLHRIRHLVVQKEREIVGVLSERDLGGKNGEGVRKDCKVSDLMSEQVVIAKPEMTIRQAANLLRGNGIGCLPVVDNGKVIGIVTISDLLTLIGKGMNRSVGKGERPTVRRPRSSFK